VPIVWNLTRERIADRALERIGALGAGQTPDAEDRNLALETLDSILKSLPLYGIIWPRVTPVSVSLSVTALSTTVAMPTDWYPSALHVNVVKTDGTERPATIIQRRDYEEIPDKTKQGNDLEYAYIGPDRIMYLWPVPTANITLKLTYQRIVQDSVSGAILPDLGPEWLMGLWNGVAAYCGDEFGVPESDLERFEGKWIEMRTRAQSANRQVAPIIMDFYE
jgi:hypothetical protein